jgi:hypothetical protein
MKRLDKRLAAVLATLLLAATLTGCAAIFNPHPQTIPVTSTPGGAQVLVDGTLVGTTPVTLELDGRTDYELLVRLNGRERRFTLESDISGTYVAQDVLPGMALAGGSAVVLATCLPDAESMGGLCYLFAGPPLALGVASSVVSVAVDSGTGQWLRLSPDHVHVTFDEASP